MPPILSRRERERLMRRQAMLDAARAVFAEKGYRKATLDEIAQRAEFGKGTLYNYFEGGKEEILFAILDEMYDYLHDLTVRIFDDTSYPSYRARLQTYIAGMLDYFFSNQDLFMILMKEVNRMVYSDDSEKMSYFMQQDERVMNVLLKALQKAIDAGELEPLPLHAIAYMIFGNVKGYVAGFYMRKSGWCLDDDDDAMAQTSDDAARFLTHVLLDGMGTGVGEAHLVEANPEVSS